MHGLQREVQEEFVNLKSLVKLPGDGLRGELDGECYSSSC
jgi:hypothetical protein